MIPPLRSPRSHKGRRTAGIVLAVASFVSLLAWAVSSPVGSSPDDDFHLSSIWCAWGNSGNLCEKVAEPDARRVPFEVTHPSCFAFDSNKSGTCKADLARQPSTDVSRWGNFVGLYPPVYYATMRAFVTDDVTTSVLTIRAVNAALAVLVMGAVALLVPAALRRTMVWAMVLTCVPLTMFVLASDNPSAWAILSAGTLWVAYYALFEASGRRRVALGVAVAVTALMGSGARGDACLYSALAITAVLVLRWGTLRRNRGPVLIGAGVIAASAALFLSSGQANTASQGLPTPPSFGPEVSNLAVTVHNVLELPTLLLGVFGAPGAGGLGWLDTPMPALAFYTSLLAAAVAVFAGLSSMSRPKAVALAGVALCLVAFPLAILAQNRNAVGVAVQPRYVLPIIVLLAGISLLKVDGRARALNLSQRCLVGAALIGAQSLALHVNLRRYVTGNDVGGLNLDARKEWWWDTSVGPMMVWAVGTLAFAVVVVIALSMRDDDVVVPVRQHDRRARDERITDQPRALTHSSTSDDAPAVEASSSTATTPDRSER
ncbi:DUF2142 domain-containing protein [Aeromicrobium endophyticum]|uniref:DUF2142 domain-containing protein n=1 Tax=Aeromicrobium endophyticum TaxID=2292704 RepID=A0A371PA77_9ACTN|nr:DUF2142 domain-containing protein [Aeromicrobium endophyticum]REK72839.1 DUF2142 domain-containing protein [Aeromicrobium endophyticum]